MRLPALLLLLCACSQRAQPVVQPVSEERIAIDALMRAGDPTPERTAIDLEGPR